MPPKKLTDAAAAWADIQCGRVSRTQPVTIDKTVQEEFARLGVTVEVSESEDDGDVISIWPENWTSLCAWMEVETQWRVVSNMRQLVYIGLDYSAVKIVLDAEGLGSEVFADLRMMEAAALPTLNEAD